MTMGKKSLHLYDQFGKKTIFIQATNTYRIKINITPDTSVLDRVIRTHFKELMSRQALRQSLYRLQIHIE